MLEKSDNGFTDPTITIEGMGNIIGSNNIVNIKSELGKADRYLAKSVPPATTKSFTGRAKELSNLFKLLCGNQKVTKIVALYGMGGVGKTSLALKFANEFRAKFPGGIYWADFASTRGNPWPILRAWARLLHEDIGQLTDINTCVEIMRSAFHKHIIEYGAILLIVDDVRESWFEAVQILKSACPSNAPVLLTTRDVELAHSLGSTTILHLDVLSTDCAVDLLGKLAGSIV
ncbi:MAG: hypothetical protein JW981_08280, partial [Anaerolineae bacterium]|nr:hypothetical protein [Anaerolineae bacterium]